MNSNFFSSTKIFATWKQMFQHWAQPKRKLKTNKLLKRRKSVSIGGLEFDNPEPIWRFQTIPSVVRKSIRTNIFSQPKFEKLKSKYYYISFISYGTYDMKGIWYRLYDMAIWYGPNGICHIIYVRSNRGFESTWTYLKYFSSAKLTLKLIWKCLPVE